MNKSTRKKTYKHQNKSTKRVHSGNGKSFNNSPSKNQIKKEVSEEIHSSVNKSIQKIIEEEHETASSDGLGIVLKEKSNSKNICKNSSIYKKLPRLECGLIKDRHDMPTSLFIFDKVQESIMFNYDELDNIVSNFIKKEVGFMKDENNEEIGAYELVVYVTGLSCCIGSLIKMCDKYKVNLTLMHFNNRNEGYHKQVIWDKFGKWYINKLFPTATNINLHDITINDMKNEKFFVIRTVELHEDGDNDVKFDIFKNQSDLWIFHGDILSKTMINTKYKIAVYVDLSEILDDKVSSVNKISSIYNWSKV